MTSFTKGSLKVIKEAMAVNCPIISTDIGDIAETITKIDGCSIFLFNHLGLIEKFDNFIKTN